MNKLPLKVPTSNHFTRAGLATALCFASLLAGGVAAVRAQPKPAQSQAAGELFTNISPMTVQRKAPSATLLGNGQVLVAGGSGVNGATQKSAELYHPATRKFTATGAMTAARTGHTVTRLRDGKVLFVGGEDNTDTNGPRLLGSAELYDPATGKFAATGALKAARRYAGATLLADGRVLICGGVGGKDNAELFNGAELYDPATGQWSTTGAMKVARINHSMTLLGNGKVLVAGGQITDIIGPAVASAELYDPATGKWSATGAMKTPRKSGLAARLPDGQVLITAGSDVAIAFADLQSAELYNPATGQWTPTGAMQSAHVAPTATALQNGQVLITGGYNAELYSPAKGTFTQIGWLKTVQKEHSATLLNDGQVLLVGGNGANGSALGNAELCDPIPAKFKTAGGPHFADSTTATLLGNGKILFSTADRIDLYDPVTGVTRTGSKTKSELYFYTATLLNNGKVLFIGNENSLQAELYDPATDKWSLTGPMKAARAGHSATLLKNGKVFILGGSGYGSPVSPELYDPATGKWSVTGAPRVLTAGQTVTLLPNGKVLIAGGYDGNGAFNKAELYDPATGKFRATGALKTARYYASATLLRNGKVLIAGGQGDSALKSAELYDPATGKFTATGAMKAPSLQHSATLLGNGKVLVAGGNRFLAGDPRIETDEPIARAELYDPATGQWSTTGSMANARMNHAATLLKNGRVLFADGLIEQYDPATGKFTDR